MRKFLGKLIGPAMLATLAGCAHSGNCCHHTECPDQEPPVVLQVVHRGLVEGQVQSIPPILIREAGKQLDRTYRALKPDVCRCLGAQTSDMGNMLDSAADSVQEQLDDKCIVTQEKIRQAKLKQDILRSAALESRNTDSAAALTRYYGVFEAEGMIEMQRQSIEVLAEAIRRTSAMRAKGLKSAEDLESLNRQQLEQLADLGRLELGLDAFNAELGRAINLEDKTCACKSRFWPTDPLHFQPDPPDCEKAVAEGLASRPELYGLQRMIDELDVKTLKMMREVMQAFNPLMALADSKPCCPMLAKVFALLFGQGKLQEEVETKREQLIRHKCERMRVISSEIREDVTNLCHRTQVIALTRQRAIAHGRRVAELETKASKELANFEQLTDAKMQWIKARGDVIKAVANWEREYVQLLMHQGVLPNKCHEVLAAPPPPPAEKPAAPDVLPPVGQQFSNRLGRELSLAAKK